MHTMNGLIVRLCLPMLLLGAAHAASAQDDGTSVPPATMRPVIRGRQAAVSSMKPEATEPRGGFCKRAAMPSTPPSPVRPCWRSPTSR